MLEADIVVTATGLQLLAFGGIQPTVDGEEVVLSDQFVWQGAMITGLPNFAICIGYTNASWTLRADLTSRLVCKILNWMDRHDYAAVVPNPTEELTARPLLDLAAGYVQRLDRRLPAAERPRRVAGAAELRHRRGHHDAHQPQEDAGGHASLRGTPAGGRRASRARGARPRDRRRVRRRRRPPGPGPAVGPVRRRRRSC